MNNKTKKPINPKSDSSNEEKYLQFRSYKPKYIKSELASTFKDRKASKTEKHTGTSTITNQNVKPEKSSINIRKSSSKIIDKKLQHSEKSSKEVNAKPKPTSQLGTNEHFPQIFATSDLIEKMKKANIATDTEPTEQTLTKESSFSGENSMIVDNEAKKDSKATIKSLTEDGQKKVNVAKNSDSVESENLKEDSCTSAENESIKFPPYMVEIQQLKQINASLMDMQAFTLNKLIQLKDIIREQNITINSLEEEKQFQVRKSYKHEKEIASLKEIIRELVLPQSNGSQTEAEQNKHKCQVHDKEIKNYKPSIFQALHNNCKQM